MGKQAVGCLAVSFAESDFMPYVSLQKKQEIRHKTGLKYLLFFFVRYYCDQEKNDRLIN